MTTNSELLDNALSRLGQRKSTRVREDTIAEINEAIDNLERGSFFPWFLQKTVTLSFVSGDSFKPLPADFAIEQEDTRPFYTQESAIFYLTKRFFGTLQGEAPTFVKFYAVHGNDFHIRMPAEKDYSITVLYNARTGGGFVDDTNDVSNLWLIDAKEWVLSMALAKVARFHLQNTPLAADFVGMEAKAKRDLYNYHESRVNLNQDFEVGGATDGS